jgi:hypothetical protein
MTKCHSSLLKARCQERGYTIDEVMPCVVSQDGDEWTIDVDHPAYPRLAKPVFVSRTLAFLSGCLAGTALKSLLASFGIAASPNCSCNARAAVMDRQGCDWCEANLDTIVGWLREEATKRGLPFLDAAGRLLVKRAIRNARKAAS